MCNLQDMLERIKKQKKQVGYTNEELSQKTGIPKSTLSKLLAGIIKEPPVTSIIKIAKALNTSADYLVFGEKINLSDNYNVKYNSLNEQGKKMVEEYIHLLLLDDKYKKTQKPPVTEQKKLPTIFYYDVPASAGTGEYLDYSTASLVSVDDNIPANASYILKVAGDSMEPRFCDGEYVYVDKNNALNFGDIGIFYYDNNVYIKKYGQKGLISLNPKYSDIKGHEDIRCLGKVIGKVNGEIYF